VRKERAQSELALQRERERNLAAEATILAQAAEIAALQQQLADSQTAYEKDTQTLRQALQESGERERHLQELSDEAYGLLTLYGVKKI
jgi:O6-methylguanine-DNA--protein-cysteine methyltransferase